MSQNTEQGRKQRPFDAIVGRTFVRNIGCRLIRLVRLERDLWMVNKEMLFYSDSNDLYSIRRWAELLSKKLRIYKRYDELKFWFMKSLLEK